MHGMPEHLDLSDLAGATLDGILLGRNTFIFHFSSKHSFTVEGGISLRDPAAGIQETGSPNELRACTQIGAFLARTVEKIALAPPESLTVHFTDGATITLYDDSQEYESFVIQPGDIIV